MEIMGVIGVMVNCALIGNKISLSQFISIFSNSLTQDCPGRCTACSRPWQPPRRCSWSSCWSTSCSSSSSSSRPLSPTLHITWHKLVKMCHWKQFVSLFDIRNLRGRNTEDARWRDWCQVSGWQISSQRSVLPACLLYVYIVFLIELLQPDEQQGLDVSELHGDGGQGDAVRWL